MMTKQHIKKDVEAEPCLKELCKELLARIEKQDEAIATLRRENSERHNKIWQKLMGIHIAAGRR